MSANFNCPVCGTPSKLIIGETQAFCTNIDGCSVLSFNPSLPDGGMSNAKYINLDKSNEEGGQ